MSIVRSLQALTYRKEQFTISYRNYYCEDTEQYFTDEHLDELNLKQVQHAYRLHYNLPFPEEVTQIREMYGLSAKKMSEILGFGTNIYRQYEQGEVPSESNARLIQMAAKPDYFVSLMHLNKRIEKKTILSVEHKIKSLIETYKTDKSLAQMLLGSTDISHYTGYTLSSLAKMEEMCRFFVNETKPYKTKLNKLLYYSDFGHFKQYGKSISGSQYRAISYGPVPTHFQSLFSHLVENDKIGIKLLDISPEAQAEQYLPIPGQTFNASIFSAEELDTLKKVLDKLGNLNGKEIVALSHDEKAWLDNQEKNQLISYDYAIELKHI